MFHCVMSHVMENAYFESDNLVKGNDILTYDLKGAWGKNRLGTTALATVVYW